MEMIYLTFNFTDTFLLVIYQQSVTYVFVWIFCLSKINSVLNTYERILSSLHSRWWRHMYTNFFITIWARKTFYLIYMLELQAPDDFDKQRCYTGPILIFNYCFKKILDKIIALGALCISFITGKLSKHDLDYSRFCKKFTVRLYIYKKQILYVSWAFIFN